MNTMVYITEVIQEAVNTESYNINSNSKYSTSQQELYITGEVLPWELLLWLEAIPLSCK